MSDICHYVFESGQFCGGPFWKTECGEYLPANDIVLICPICGKAVEEIDEE